VTVILGQSILFDLSFLCSVESIFRAGDWVHLAVSGEMPRRDGGSDSDFVICPRVLAVNAARVPGRPVANWQLNTHKA